MYRQFNAAGTAAGLNLPPKLRFPFVVEFLIERHLLAQVAAKDGIGESEDYKRRLAAYQAKALRDSYLAQKISPAVTEDEIKAAYEKEAAKKDSDVKQLAEAQAKELEELAKKSIGLEKFDQKLD